ncbi:response regulator transcription factor [Herbaspirillum huttiense]|uniref:winged helix-turn-helix domain-containing protein n=1 Tax=Herbaspirillum TaxID=963 RepID=UPI001066F207|nr:MULTISPECIES: response regulator transcription factor [Herbaspirillum]MCI1016753.1 response regulator transcription factor [Herbaspirillum sp. C7C2]QBP73593.1 response regulator transcription factor [Herbaspirillum huttiense]
MTATKLLIVEDNERVARFLKKGLSESGYEVDHADNGRDGMLLATSTPYAAIIMDRMLPGGIDGLSIIEALRKTGNKVPILILSAMAEVDDRIKGLQSGGDDYLVKPFSFGELLARVEAIARRARESTEKTYLVIGNLHLDVMKHKVYRDGKALTLQPREFLLLEYLMRHANQVVTRTMLLQNVWNYDFDPQTNVVEVHISKLRQKLDGDSRPSILRTIRNAGYMLTDE